MSTRSRVAAATISVALSVSLAACADGSAVDQGADPSADGEQVNLRFASIMPSNNVLQTCGADQLAETVNASDSGIQIEVFADAQLGNASENIQSVASGEIDMAFGSPDSLTNFYDGWGITYAPYAFEDWEHLQRSWNGSVGETLREGLFDATSIHVPGLWFVGARHLTADMEVHEPSDLEGVEIRSGDSAISRALVEGLGAEAVPIDFTELYLALQQGVVTGQENPILTIATGKFNEVQDYLMLTGHVISPTTILLSDAAYEKLSDDQREYLTDAIAEQGQKLYDCTAELEEKQLQEWIDAGEFTVIPQDELDMDAFRQSGKEAALREFPQWRDGLWDQVEELSID